MIKKAEGSSLQLAAKDGLVGVAQLQSKPASKMSQIEMHPAWDLLAALTLRLKAGVSVPHFKVKHLLTLSVGAVLETAWENEADVPLKCGEVQLGWAEFEVVDQRLAVRITKLA